MKEIDTRRLSHSQLREHVDTANRDADRNLDNPDFAVTVMDRCQLVYGVWMDATKPHGVGIAILKGIKLIEAALQRGGSATFSVGRIRCRSRDAAKVCSILWGDLQHLKHHFDEAEA
jgi:hypothetical protein